MAYAMFYLGLPFYNSLVLLVTVNVEAMAICEGMACKKIVTVIFPGHYCITKELRQSQCHVIISQCNYSNEVPIGELLLGSR